MINPKGIDVSGRSPALDLVAYIDGTAPANPRKSDLYSYIDTLNDAERTYIRGEMIASIARVFPDHPYVVQARQNALNANAADPRIHPTFSDRTENSLARHALDDVVDTVDSTDGWTPTGPDDPHLAFGNTWVVYLVTARLLTEANTPDGTDPAFNPNLTLGDCTAGLRRLRDQLIKTEPVERGHYVAGMFYAINQRCAIPPR